MVQEYGSKSNVISAVPFKENGRASESAFKNQSAAVEKNWNLSMLEYEPVEAELGFEKLLDSEDG